MVGGIIFAVGVAAVIAVVTFVKTEFRRPLMKLVLVFGLSLLVYACALSANKATRQPDTLGHFLANWNFIYIGAIALNLSSVDILSPAAIPLIALPVFRYRGRKTSNASL